MADLWLEKELARQLAPVAAPESLWDRVNSRQRKPRRRISLEWAFWPVAAAMLLLTLAGIIGTLKADRNPDRLTEQELAAVGAPGEYEFRSDSFDETRAWVKAEANIDIDVPSSSGTTGHVRLLGARLIRLRGSRLAAIDYRVGDQAATLLVSGKRAGLTGNTEESPHLFSRTNPAGNERLVSWNMRNQAYTIAYSGPKNSRAACLLCHTNTPS
jgi:hypothetical protein